MEDRERSATQLSISGSDENSSSSIPAVQLLQRATSRSGSLALLVSELITSGERESPVVRWRRGETSWEGDKEDDADNRHWDKADVYSSRASAKAIHA